VSIFNTKGAFSASVVVTLASGKEVSVFVGQVNPESIPSQAVGFQPKYGGFQRRYGSFTGHDVLGSKRIGSPTIPWLYSWFPLWNSIRVPFISFISLSL
jgi:hypothetical protein